MLRIVHLEEIHGLMLRIPALADLLERRGQGYVREVREWLGALERALQNNRSPVAGSIAALRGILVSAERGLIPAGVTIQGAPTTRKVREATAAEVVRQASDLVLRALADDMARIAEAERLGHQIAAVAKHAGLLDSYADGTGAGGLKALWRAITASPDLHAGAVRLESLVGPHDVLIVLDRAVSAGRK